MSEEITGAKRLQNFDKPTVWSIMTQLAMETKSVNLGQGFPSWSPPDFYIKNLENSQKQCHQYTRAFGSLSLVYAIAAYHKRFAKLNPEEEIVTVNGGAEGLFDSILGFVDQGDEVVFFDPSYDCYRAQVQLAGGRSIGIPLKPKFQQSKAMIKQRCKKQYISGDTDQWQIDFQLFQKSLTKKTKMFILNSPHNPIGKVFTNEQLSRLALILQKFPKIVVVEDNVYQGMTFDDMFGKELPKMAFQSGMEKRTLSVYSAGKIFAATGVRSGWVIGHSKLIRSVRSVHQYNVTCAYKIIENTVAQSLKQITKPQNTFLCPSLHLACKKCTQTILFRSHESPSPQKCPQCQQEIQEKNIKKFKLVYFVRRGAYKQEMEEERERAGERSPLEEKVQVLEIFISEEEERIRELMGEGEERERRIGVLEGKCVQMEKQLGEYQKEIEKLRQQNKLLKQSLHAKQPQPSKSLQPQQQSPQQPEIRTQTSTTHPTQSQPQLQPQLQLQTIITTILDLPSWTHLRQLQEINLGDRKEIQSLPDSWGKFDGLKVLVLGRCRLAVLPGSFGELGNLTYLELDQNRLKALPDSFCQLKELTFLHLYSNFLTQLPQQFGKLTNLLQLFLSENKLTHLPSSFSSLTSLTVLSLQSNPLLTFPPSFPQLLNLQYLEFSILPPPFRPPSFSPSTALTLTESSSSSQSHILKSLHIPKMEGLKKLVIWYAVHIEEEENQRLLEECLDGGVVLEIQEEWERLR